jgi:hypothetical protein
VIPSVTGLLFELAERALPVLVNVLNFFMDNGQAIIDATAEAFDRLGPLLRELGSTILDVLPSLFEIGLIVGELVIPALTSFFDALGTVGDLILDLDEDLRRLVIAALLTAPAIAEGTVHVGEIGGSGAAGFLTALDGEDGTVQWRRGIDGPVAGAVAVTGGRVYAAGSTGSGGFVTALDRRDGTVRWVREGQVPFRNPPIVAGGTVYVTDESGRVHGLETGDGSRQFRHATGDTLVGSPIAANGSLYLVGEEHSVYALGTSPGSGTVTRISGR